MTVGEIDLIIFSGDLVFSGVSIDAFQQAHSEMLKKVAISARVPEDRLLIAPGNHDLHRAVALDDDITELGLRQALSSRDAINHFVGKNASGFDGHAVARMRPFYDFIEGRGLPTCVHRDPFVEIHRLKLPQIP